MYYKLKKVVLCLAMAGALACVNLTGLAGSHSHSNNHSSSINRSSSSSFHNLGPSNNLNVGPAHHHRLSSEGAGTSTNARETGPKSEQGFSMVPGNFNSEVVGTTLQGKKCGPNSFPCKPSTSR